MYRLALAGMPRALFMYSFPSELCSVMLPPDCCRGAKPDGTPHISSDEWLRQLLRRGGLSYPMKSCLVRTQMMAARRPELHQPVLQAMLKARQRWRLATGRWGGMRPVGDDASCNLLGGGAGTLCVFRGAPGSGQVSEGGCVLSPAGGRSRHPVFRDVAGFGQGQASLGEPRGSTGPVWGRE